jgi:hypothetical protein
VETNLNAKIDSVETNLNAKIDSVETNLNATIDSLRNELQADPAQVRDILAFVRRQQDAPSYIARADETAIQRFIEHHVGNARPELVRAAAFEILKRRALFCPIGAPHPVVRPHIFLPVKNKLGFFETPGAREWVYDRTNAKHMANLQKLLFIPQWETRFDRVSARTITPQLLQAGVADPEARQLADQVVTHFGDPAHSAYPGNDPNDATPYFVVAKHPETEWFFEKNVQDRMVRPVYYWHLWSKLDDLIKKDSTDGNNGLIVSGQPGIGKTLLLDLLLSMILATYPHLPVITIASEAFMSVFVSPLQHAVSQRDFAASEFADDLQANFGLRDGSKIIVLHDIKGDDSGYQGDVIRGLKQRFHLTCVLAASPQERNTKGLAKDMAAHHILKHYLPALSEMEARAVFRRVWPGPGDFAARFKVVGGVLRQLLKKDFRGDEIMCEQRLVSGGIRWNPSVVTNLQDSHKVVKVIPSADGSRIQAHGFISVSAFEQWTEVNEEKRIEGLQTCALQARLCDSRVVYGIQFEKWVLQMISDKMPLSRQLLLGDASSMLSDWAPAIQSSVLFDGNSAGKISSSPNVPTLWVPRSANFPVIDAAIVFPTNTVTLIQVTVANRHPPTLSATHTLFQALENSNLTITEFVWITDGESELSAVPRLSGDVVRLSQQTTKDTYGACQHYLCRVDPLGMVYVKNPASVVVSFPRMKDDRGWMLREAQRYVDPHATAFDDWTGNGTRTSPYILT